MFLVTEEQKSLRLTQLLILIDLNAQHLYLLANKAQDFILF